MYRLIIKIINVKKFRKPLVSIHIFAKKDRSHQSLRLKRHSMVPEHCIYQTSYASMAKARAMGIARSWPSLVPRHIYSDVRGVRVWDGQRRRNGEKKYTHRAQR